MPIERSRFCADLKDIAETLLEKDSYSYYESEQTGYCGVDIKNKQFEKYLTKRKTLAQTVSSIGISDSDKVTMEALVPSCSGRVLGEILPVDVAADFCTPCNMDHVHIHSGGPAPTTHIHVDCDLKQISAKRHCLAKLVSFFTKVDEHTKRTCE